MMTSRTLNSYGISRISLANLRYDNKISNVRCMTSPEIFLDFLPKMMLLDIPEMWQIGVNMQILIIKEQNILIMTEGPLGSRNPCSNKVNGI